METFVGDTINFGIRTSIDVSTYGINRICYVKPNGDAGYWEASADPDDLTRMQHTMAHDDLDMSGTWLMQAYVEGGGEFFYGIWVELKVFKPLPIR